MKSTTPSWHPWTKTHLMNRKLITDIPDVWLSYRSGTDRRKAVETILLSLLHCTLFVCSIALFIYRRSLPPPQTIELNSGEYRMYSVNPYFFSRVDLVDPSGKINTYYFNQIPSIARTVSNIERTETMTLEPGEFSSWSRWLNVGSLSTLEVNVTDASVSTTEIVPAQHHQTTSALSLCTFSGRENYERWKKGSGTCVTHPPLSELFQESSTSNEHFFVVENSGADKTKLIIHISIRSTIYDIGPANGFYGGSFRMDLNFGEKRWLVIVNPSDRSAHSVTMILTDRSKNYLFVTVFVQVVLLLTHLWNRCHREEATEVPKKRRKLRAEEAQPRVVLKDPSHLREE
ncbi:hypothetical protein PROFUN_03963 [Planoprotostelium fungivorum]|uniref:Uncharacterized protein n=1 Tax=Planoprotostelium fungivorum TaxID=1890364 RepID=A0A2P6MTW5_9EUKA|nr:hypothetical protein PROFUN_03963 [Planoprotostelium fungivorum]